MKNTKWLRWLARGIGTLAAGFWLIVILITAFVGDEEFTFQSWILIILIIASAWSVVAAWGWELIGGACVLACGLAHAVFALISSGHNHALAVAVSGVPFLLSGSLFLLSWFRSQDV